MKTHIALDSLGIGGSELGGGDREADLTIQLHGVNPPATGEGCQTVSVMLCRSKTIPPLRLV